MFKIIKTPENTQQIDELRKKLTVTPLTNSPIPFIRPVPIKMFLESERTLRIPFAYAVNKAKIATKDDVARRVQAIEANAVKVDFAFSGSIQLRDYQEAAVCKTLHALKTTGGAIINQSTGSGKTITCLAVLARLKKKALILVHKQFLADQFYKSIEMCMPGTTVTFVQGQKVDFSGDIVIAMLQTLTMGSREFPKDTFKPFSIVCVDETHHIGAPVLSRSIMNLGDILTLGLSATVARPDGLKPEWLMGKISYKYDNTSTNKPQLWCIDYHDEKPIEFIFNVAGQINSPAMINNLVLDMDRNRLIIDCLEKIYQKNEEDIEEDPEGPRRFTLVTSDRRGHLETLYDLMQENDVLKKYKTGFAVGQMKRQAFDDACKNSDILLGTYQMISEGFDVVRLNTMLLSSPKSSLNQVVGRILRQNHVGIQPMIVDIFDHAVYSFIPAGKKRLAFYKSREYPIIHANTLELDRVLDVEEEDQSGGVVDGVPLAPSGEIDFSTCLL